MRAYPELIRGPVATDTRLMRRCRAGSRRAAPKASFVPPATESASRSKADDGNGRALGPAAAQVFAQLDLDLGELAITPS